MKPYADKAYPGGQGIGTQSYPQPTAPAPQRETVNNALERCGVLLNELAAAEQRLAGIAQRLDGPVPENSKEAGSLQPAPCLVGSASHIAGSLDRLISRVNSQINRIESALG